VSFLSHASDSEFGQLIYISRGDSVNLRRLVNEDYLFSVLMSVGFKSYRLSELSVADQIALFSQAKMIVGVHGAGLANLVFASYRAVVYELFSSVYKPSTYESISRLVGLDYQSVVSDEYDNYESPQKADFRISDSNVMNIVRHAEKLAS
jgi:capsular polysaccharide biosynthesis protein